MEKEERVVTLQFLPNSELLLVGTNKRLLLIVVGAAATPGAATVQASDLDPGLNSGICGDVWNVSIDLLRDSSNTFSPQAREQSLSHWLSQSPTPYKRQYMNMNMNTDASKDSDMTFVSWIELDQVPPYCEGIFSMSVGPEGGQGGSEHGSGSGSGSEQGRGQGQGQDEEMSIFLWKVILQLEVPILDRDVLVPVPASADTVTPKIPALNLNLKEEKETPFMNDDSKNNRTTARSNFDVDVDDLSDCRVYRLKWTAEMFRTAFKNSKAIPQHALEDHLSKIY